MGTRRHDRRPRMCVATTDVPTTANQQMAVVRAIDAKRFGEHIRGFDGWGARHLIVDNAELHFMDGPLLSDARTGVRYATEVL